MYKPTQAGAWKGRVDAQDGEEGKRWHQGMQLLDLSATAIVSKTDQAVAFLGFCCEEGVQRNQGRVGAAAGPVELRKAMASFAWHLEEKAGLYDAGDVFCTNQNLEEAQKQLGSKIYKLLQQGFKTIVLGGGHEIAYGHFLGIEQALKPGQQLGIINFDAHFDLRSYEKQPSSGTPFLQIADDLKAAGKEFNYLVLGLQEQGNTRKLFNTAAGLGVTYVLAQELQLFRLEELKKQIKEFISKVDVLYLTIDLDVFAAAYAPGVSAPAALGVQPEIVMLLLHDIIASGKLLSLDVAELNPSYDLDSRTARLGVSLLYQIVKNWLRV